MASEQEERRQFENEVRRVAEAVWGLSPGDCQPQHYTQDAIVRELDGLVRLRDVTHLVMVTVSRKLEKCKGDVRKLNAAERIEKRSGTATRKWFITKFQLEAEHIQHCRESNVTTLTLQEFRNRFFNGRDYIARRRNAAFGSARNPTDDSITLPNDEYIDTPIRVFANENGRLAAPQDWSIEQLQQELLYGRLVVLLGPFGAGKSLTVREVFSRIAERYLSGSAPRVPIALSLREHWGARYADEILERHAKEIGFSPREDILVAYRAGLSYLLLDGFDEVATQVVAGATDKFMRESRFQALEATRKIIGEMPTGTGCLITGRDHYFDNLTELSTALGIRQRPHLVAELGEFTEDAANLYLRRKGSELPLPDWVPRKPLILGYLARHSLLDEVIRIDGSQGFGHAWDAFLALICNREAAYGRGIMDPDALRSLLERLAWDVRGTATGTGPITERDLAEAYRAETGLGATEGVLMQLQRLPGLTPRDQDPGSRAFIDADMLAALQGSALARFVLEGKTPGSGRRSIDALAPKALAFSAYRFTGGGVDEGTIIAAGTRSRTSDQRTVGDAQLAADCFAVALEMSADLDGLSFHGATVESASFGRINLEERRVENLVLRDCFVDEICVGAATTHCSIKFDRCAIQRVLGVSGVAALPMGIVHDCDIDNFDEMATNSAIVNSSLPERLKVLLTVLRKLYVQAGAGRKLAALKRGLPPGHMHDLVDEIVDLLELHGLVRVSAAIAHPVRRHGQRVRDILGAPTLSQDPICIELTSREHG